MQKNEISNKLRELPTDLLHRLGVALVYLFGSRAEGVAGPLSDTDIGIIFIDPKIAQGDTREIYNSLYDIFSEALKNEHIDIVFLERANLELQFDVITHGKTLFAVSEDFRHDFEHRVTML